MPPKMSPINMGDADLTPEDFKKLHPKLEKEAPSKKETKTPKPQKPSRNLPNVVPPDETQHKINNIASTTSIATSESQLAGVTEHLLDARINELKREISIIIDELIKNNKNFVQNQFLTHQSYDQAFNELRAQGKEMHEEFAKVKMLLNDLGAKFNSISPVNSLPVTPTIIVTESESKKSLHNKKLREKSVSKMVRFPPFILDRISQLGSIFKMNDSAIIKYAVNVLYEQKFSSSR